MRWSGVYPSGIVGMEYLIKFYAKTEYWALKCQGQKRERWTSLASKFSFPKFLLLSSHANILSDKFHVFTFFFPFVVLNLIAFVFVENTRTVAANLGCKKSPGESYSSNRVNVLIPEVIQVYSELTFEYY